MEFASFVSTLIGDMWLKPGSKPLDFSAVQTISAVDVGFLWRAWFRMAGASMQVIDYMVAGRAGLEGPVTQRLTASAHDRHRCHISR